MYSFYSSIAREKRKYFLFLPKETMLKTSSEDVKNIRSKKIKTLPPKAAGRLI